MEKTKNRCKSQGHETDNLMGLKGLQSAKKSFLVISIFNSILFDDQNLAFHKGLLLAIIN